jgi:hypothetical protein
MNIWVKDKKINFYPVTTGLALRMQPIMLTFMPENINRSNPYNLLCSQPV